MEEGGLSGLEDEGLERRGEQGRSGGGGELCLWWKEGFCGHVSGVETCLLSCTARAVLWKISLGGCLDSVCSMRELFHENALGWISSKAWHLMGDDRCDTYIDVSRRTSRHITAKRKMLPRLDGKKEVGTP